MEMERINENTIKVLLENSDLVARGMTVLDLLGNQKKIESFFYSILDEVDVDHDFIENDAVTFQLVPSGSGLELFITKVNPENGEQTFNPVSDLEAKGKNIRQVDVNSITDEVAEIFQRQIEDSLPGIKEIKKTRHRFLKDNEMWKVVEFNDFEDLLMLAHGLDLTDVSTSLYFFQGKYYLFLMFFGKKESFVKNMMANVFEYAQKVPYEPIYVREHGKIIIQSDVIKKLKQHF